MATGDDKTNTPAQGSVPDPQRDLKVFIAVSIGFVIVGVLIGALTGSEPAAPSAVAPATAVVAPRAP